MFRLFFSQLHSDLLHVVERAAEIISGMAKILDVN